MKIKVQDLAKKYNKSLQEIKEALEQVGIVVKSHLSTVEEKYDEKLALLFKPSQPKKAVLRKKIEIIEEMPIVKVEKKEETIVDKVEAKPLKVDKIKESFKSDKFEIKKNKQEDSLKKDLPGETIVQAKVVNATNANKNEDTKKVDVEHKKVEVRQESAESIKRRAEADEFRRSKEEMLSRSKDRYETSVSYDKNVTESANKDVVEEKKRHSFTIKQNEDNRIKRKEVDKKSKEEEKVLDKIITTTSSSRKNNRKKKREEFEKEIERERNVLLEERMIKCKQETTVKELAEKIGISAVEIVKELFLEGKVYNVNSYMPFEVVEALAIKYNVLVEKEEEIEKYKDVKIDLSDLKDSRAPVIAIMGHVDHGKTSLLDKIRSSKVTSTEAGGITQKIGAYQVNYQGKDITFLDTPGHKAFMDMRARGASITDIAVLVVAADDGVMPQTIEAISHAKFAKIPIIVAINKIDKPGKNLDRLKQELSEHGVMHSSWGGQEEFIEISALTGANIDKLLETILLQAEVMELKCSIKGLGRVVVVESRLDPHSGPVADVIVQNGTLRIGDPLVCASFTGKVRYMINDAGQRIKEAKPSTPVQLAGLSEVPETGDIIQAVDSEKSAKRIASERKLETKKSEVYSSLHSLGEKSDKEWKIVLKSNSKGSLEAIRSSLLKIFNEEVKLVIIQATTGSITSSDIKLASAANATILAFEMIPNNSLKQEAEHMKVEINSFSIIYELIEYVEDKLKGKLTKKVKEVYQGRLEVRKVFTISRLGTIAGCVVTDGLIERKSIVKLIRDKKVIHEGKMSSLKRLKDDISKATLGQDCGVKFEGFNDVHLNDIIESYTQETN